MKHCMWCYMLTIIYIMTVPQVTVEPVLKDRPTVQKTIVALDRWSLGTDWITLKCETFCPEYLVFQDRWLLMAVVSQELDKFHCNINSFTSKYLSCIYITCICKAASVDCSVCDTLSIAFCDDLSPSIWKWWLVLGQNCRWIAAKQKQVSWQNNNEGKQGSNSLSTQGCAQSFSLTGSSEHLGPVILFILKARQPCQQIGWCISIYNKKHLLPQAP